MVSIKLNDETIVRPNGINVLGKVIDDDHPNIIEGLLRLKRACQVTKTKLDQLENLLFSLEESDYDFTAKSTVEDLKGMAMTKLQASELVATHFAWFLVEQNQSTTYENQIDAKADLTTTSI